MANKDKIAALKTAKSEAQRFIARADIAIKRLEQDQNDWGGSSADLATAKRSSMDLTRVLAALRRAA